MSDRDLRRAATRGTPMELLRHSFLANQSITLTGRINSFTLPIKGIELPVKQVVRLLAWVGNRRAQELLNWPPDDGEHHAPVSILSLDPCSKNTSCAYCAESHDLLHGVISEAKEFPDVLPPDYQQLDAGYTVPFNRYLAVFIAFRVAEAFLPHYECGGCMERRQAEEALEMAEDNPHEYWTETDEDLENEFPLAEDMTCTCHIVSQHLDRCWKWLLSPSKLKARAAASVEPLPDPLNSVFEIPLGLIRGSLMETPLNMSELLMEQIRLTTRRHYPISTIALPSLAVQELLGYSNG